MEKWVVGLVGIVLILTVGIYVLYQNFRDTSKDTFTYPETLPVPSKQQIPQDVLNVYNSSEVTMYGFSAEIDFCRKDDKAGYRIKASGGLSAVEVYFDLTGVKFKANYYGDVPVGETPADPFAGYTCAALVSRTSN